MMLTAFKHCSLALLAASTLCSAAAASPDNPANSIAARELAPTGKLRAAINVGNPILATRNAEGGEPLGVSVDLARELARRLAVPLELVVYNAAGKVVEAAKNLEWDIGFVAIDPERAADIFFTAGYVVIEGSYLVRQDSPISSNAEVDRPGVRVVVGKGSVYDLFLTRAIKQAELVRAPTSPEVTNMMLAQGDEVAAGITQQLQADAQRIPGLRLLDGRFMVINQAMAMPLGRPVGARYLARFVEEMKATGFVQASLARHGIKNASVAPLATP